MKAVNDMSWKSAQEDAELLPKAIAAKDKEITSLCKNILTELGPESQDWDQAQRQATSCRMLLAIKRDGTMGEDDPGQAVVTHDQGGH